jgi:periplasmic protein TonB
VLALVCVLMLVVKIKVLISEDSHKKKRNLHTVTLLKPLPPPPPVKEKPPEAKEEKVEKVEKKEEIIEAEQNEPEPSPTKNEATDEPPPGEDLALDAEGGSGSDGFGLGAKKGGRALISGDAGRGEGGRGGEGLMRKYGWYTRILQDELRKKLNRYLEQNGGTPDSDVKAVVQIKLDEFGTILDFSVKDSSGDLKMDKAVLESFKMAKISEPPPDGMPRTIKLRISSKG